MANWPIFDDEQVEAVARVLRSGRVNAWTGPEVGEFEAAFAKLTGTEHAMAMANGTVTLDTALRVLDLEPGDEVIVSPRSFVASASCVMLAGGIPIFADVDRDSQNITPATIAPLIGPRTRGILAVHHAGWPCDMAGILDLASAHDLWVIEDCAQAHGAKIDGQHIGGFGTFGSFSFCQDKIMTTGGEGGLLVTNDETLFARAWSFKDHGKNRATVMAPADAPGFRWLHDGPPGTNLRMTGMQAALGLVQIARLPEWRRIRSRNAHILVEALAEDPLFRVPLPAQGITHAYYRFYVFLRLDALAGGWNRDRILDEIKAAGFQALTGSCPEIYRERVFADHGLGPSAPLPVAQELGETSLAFLVDPAQTEEDLAELADVLKAISRKAVRKSTRCA
ncbi:MAG: DegT/DnrJ/EryC1/StrS aminotransferase family protein [Pseudomonadota bacterium]